MESTPSPARNLPSTATLRNAMKLLRKNFGEAHQDSQTTPL